MALFFTGYPSLFDRKMEMNTSQLKWRWTTVSLISVDNTSQNVLQYVTEFRETNIPINRLDSLSTTAGEKHFKVTSTS